MSRTNGEGAPGTVRISDVAAHAGVSVGTVSNVLNGRGTVALEYVERVTKAIEELGFVRNDLARALRSGDSRTIGLLVLDGKNPFFTDLARAAEDEAEGVGAVVLVGNTHRDATRESFYLDAFAQQQARGIIIVPVGDVGARLERLRERGISSVVLQPEHPSPNSNSISVDNEEGGRIAARHLLETGRRRIAFAGGPIGMEQISRRHAGAAAEIDGWGRGASLQVFETDDLTVAHGREVGHRLLRLPGAERPDAVFAANDLVALGILDIVGRDGIRVPDDVAVIGYDDIDFARTAAVPLSSIRQPSEQLGQIAVQMIEDDRANPGRPPSHVSLHPSLSARESTLGRPDR
jgi:LacI family transcriptional regulator